MTNPTPPGQVPEALRLADECGYELAPGTREEIAAELLRLHAENEALRTQQPAPATQQAGEVVAYLDIGAGGYLDLGSELSDEDLQQLPKGRHALVIAGTYGIDGYVAAPQSSPAAQAASSAVLKAIREANMQLVRTGDNAFMLVPYKVATAQSAESVPAVSDLPPLPDPDLRDVGMKPQDVKDFLNGYATEYARLALAARAPADSVPAQVLVAALIAAKQAINSMKAEAETAAQGDEQMMLEACETISNEGLQADIAIRAALASAQQPAPSAAVLDYPHARRFGGCPACGRSDCVAMSCTRTTSDDLLHIAARKQGGKHDNS